MLVVAAIEEDGLLGRPVAPIGRWVVQGGITRPGSFEPGRDFNLVGDELGMLIKDRESESRARRE